MDDKHSGDGDEEVENNGDFVAEKGKHLRANFADSSRMMKKMIANWGQTEKLKFDLIVLDYFFCPAGYVQERWKEKFFSESLPLLGQDILTAGGEVWLPNMHYVQTMLDKHRDKLVNWYRWEAVADPNRNPLYQATQLVDHMLNRCPDGRTNETQLSPLKDVSDKVTNLSHIFSSKPFLSSIPVVFLLLYIYLSIYLIEDTVRMCLLS
jgi:hypothetical protein